MRYIFKNQYAFSKQEIAVNAKNLSPVRCAAFVGELFAISFFSLSAGFGGVPAQAAELIVFEQDNCGWCDRFHEEIGPVYPNTAEGRLAPLRMIDIHEPLPDDLAGIEKGRFTPTFVLVDDGREVGRMRGYPGDEFFWGLLGELLAKLPADAKSDEPET